MNQVNVQVTRTNGWAVFVLSVINGVPVSERQFTDALIGYAEALGWLCWHVRPARTASGWRSPMQGNGAKGVLDTELIRGKRLLKIELKTDSGQLTPEQRLWVERYQAAGIECHVLRPRDWRTIEKILSQGDPG